MNPKRRPPRFSLLLVDDDPSVLNSLKRVFVKAPYRIETAETGEKALRVLEAGPCQAAVLDLKMPGMDGLELLGHIRERHPETEVIILTGHGGVKDAVLAMRKGALDFLEKPFEPETIRAKLARVFELWRLREENRGLRSEMDFQFGFDRFVGNAPAMLNLKQLIVHAAPSDAPVLIQGETGTGKELVARALHRHSTRSAEPFIPVDCAAISETVIESELFGHVRGAFTGAHSTTLGLIRSAEGGTLFLDELAELSRPVQGKLLRTLQECQVRPVGSTRIHPVNIRIVAATNRDLETEVTKGRFREDLMYRLNVVALKVPPLRKRMEDIPLLTRYFLKRFTTGASPVKGVSSEALNLLDRYAWPGNVRELENFLRRGVALGTGPELTVDDFPPHMSGLREVPGGGFGGAFPPEGSTLADWEKAAIQNALSRCGGRRRRAATLLGIGEATLYRKIKVYNLARQPAAPKRGG